MEQVGKTALVFGPTGAVGREVIDLLINDRRYDRVFAFSRRVLDVTHPKLEVILDNLKDLSVLKSKIAGDDLFCCLGTTSRKAGSKENFKKVDLEMPVQLAEIASKNGITGFIAVSSIGAGKPGRGFYLDVKTKMENQVLQYNFNKLSFVRPSLLIGERDEFRFGESAGILIDKMFSWAMVGKLEKYKGISTRVVADAMIEIVNSEKPKIVYESDELIKISNLN